MRISLLAAVGAFALAVAGAAFPPPESIKVAMVAYLFEDQNKDQMLKQMGPFIENMQKDTGSKAEFVIVDDLPTLTRELNANKIQVAVLPSVDFGWLRREAPTVKPLLVAGVDGGKLRAVVLAAKKSSLAKLEELKGKTLAWPKRSPQHLKFFLRREFGGAVEESFKAKEVRSVDDALDAVIDGDAEIACVGSGQAKVFQEQKPGRFNRLKLVGESIDFPPPVVVYQSKGASEEKIRKFADAMEKANQNAAGQQTLTLWRLKGFERVPADYEETLAAALKKYPKP